MYWRKEKDLQVWFTGFLKSEIGKHEMREIAGVKNICAVACAYELKLVREKARGRFSLRQVEDHQWEALRRFESVEGLPYKISDSALGWKPFDCFFVAQGRGFLVIGYQDSNEVAIVEPSALQSLKQKSVTKEEMQKVAVLWIEGTTKRGKRNRLPPNVLTS